MGSMAAAIRRQISTKSQFHLLFRNYFTTARIVMNNKSAVLDDTLSKNPFYEKYAAKIVSLQQNDPEKLVERLEKLTSSQAPSKAATKTSQPEASQCPKINQESRGNYMQSQAKKLDEIMKTELLSTLPADEIGTLWHKYYVDKNAVSAVIPHDVYQNLHKRAMENPTFLFALPRDEGYEFMVCQFAGNEAHFTTLINFQTHGENSPECLTLVYYADLAEEKKIVLMKGDYDKNMLTGLEAQCLVNEVMLYYATPNESKLQLLEKFTKDPANFQHLELIRELENIKIE